MHISKFFWYLKKDLLPFLYYRGLTDSYNYTLSRTLIDSKNNLLITPKLCETSILKNMIDDLNIELCKQIWNHIFDLKN